MTVNPFSLEDDRSKGGPKKSGFPRMQMQSSSSRFYVKTTRGGGGRRYFREGYSNTADYAKPVIKSRFIYRGPDSTRHLIHHVDYMMKSKIDKEREPEIRKLFDREGNEITREEGIHKAVSNQTREMAGHKLILSPGDNNVDLVEYTREQMKVLEDRFNARIEYSFSFQKNTDHYHSHVTLPASAERKLDFSSDETGGRVEIKLSRDDFAAMRDAASKYMRDYNFVDHLTDRRVSEDLLPDWYGEEARKRENFYNSKARKELGLELTQADKIALKELGIELPYGGNVEISNKSKQRKADPHIEGPGVFKDELTRFLLDRDAKFENDWSERDTSRILQTSERDPEWIFPSAYAKHRDDVENRAGLMESLRSDSRFDEFSSKLQTFFDLQKAEQSAERLKSGHVKGQFVPDSERMQEFFASEKGSLLYEKLIDAKNSVDRNDGSDTEKFRDLNSSIDRHMLSESERVSEKYGLEVSRETNSEPERFTAVTADELSEHTKDIKKMMRVLNYKSSGPFVDSFERLVELKDGADSIPKYQSVDERNYFLSEKLNMPEYQEERDYFGLLQERAFQLHSRFSTGDTFDSKDAVRDSQFALDSKIMHLDQERFEDSESRRHGFHERSAEAHALNYQSALEEGNTEQASIEAKKFHGSVMKFDDERRMDEFAFEANYDQEHRHGSETLSGDFRHASGAERGEDDFATIDEPGGPSLPLPGYGLERLERDPGDGTLDPSEIQIELTSDEHNRRDRDDDEESGHQRQL